MTRMAKPPYIEPAAIGTGQTLDFGPPLLFRDVTARVFPLKANIGRLTEFCDSYLNMDIPPEIVRFTPALPYVYFMVLNYGGMSATSLAAQRAGWVSQHEVFFLVPLQRWRREHGKLVFKGWADATPFIFVDDPMSQTTGREVYGWPKVQAWITADEQLWAKHPRSPTRLFTMKTNVFANVYAGDRDDRRELVTVDRDMVASWAEFPLDLGCPWSPKYVWPNLMRNSLSLMGEALDIAAGLRMRGYPQRDLQALIAMGREALSLGGAALTGVLPGPLARLLRGPRPDADPYELGGSPARLDAPRFFTNSINLKQFRDPERPDYACYTALIDSAMGVDRVNGIGLLGDWDLLRGDPSGGYSVSIRRYEAQPIIETLGIETPTAFAHQAQGDVVKLRPTFPFWMDVDLLYGAGKVLCSFGDDGWIDESAGTTPPPPAPAPQPHLKPMRSSATPGAGFNTSLGAATQPVIGPFTFPDMTIQVYPLLANRHKLQALVDGAWNALFAPDASGTPPMHLELMGNYVYLVVTSNGDRFGTMYSNTDNIGWWADREVSFCIPVKWYREGKLASVALIEPFVYANKARAVVTDREVNGRNSMLADIDNADDVWMQPGGPNKPRRFVHVAAETFEALDRGGKATKQTLMEIDERDALKANAADSWLGVAENWGQKLADELKRKTALWTGDGADIFKGESLALEPLARFAPFNRLTLKQYRDAEDMGKACYQQVVHTERTVTHVYDLSEMEKPPHIWLHRLVNHPLAESLGLDIKATRSGRHGVIDCLQPIRPFWMRVELREELGRIVPALPPIPTVAASHAARAHRNRTPAARQAPAPYFLAPGLTHVVPAWPKRMSDDERLALADKVDIWLQSALANEIASGWALLQGKDVAQAREAVKQAASPEPHLQADIDRFFDLARADASPADAATFLRTLPIARKYDLSDALRAALGQLPLRDQTRGDVLERLGLQAQTIEKLSPEGLRKFVNSLPPVAAPPAEEAPPAAAAPAPTLFGDLIAAFAAGIDRASAQAGRVFGREGAETHVLASLAAVLGADPPSALLRGIDSADIRPAGRKAMAEPHPMPSASGDLFERLRLLEAWILCVRGEIEVAWDSLIPEQAAESIDNIRLKRFLADGDLDAEQRRLVEATFDAAGYEALNALLAHAAGPHPTPFHLLQRQYDSDVLHGLTPALNPMSALRTVSDKFGACVEDWRNPMRWRRLSREDAGRLVGAMEEVQLIVEAILDHGWESRGKSAPAAGPQALRAPGVPASSVGPFAARASDDWAVRHGLRRETGPDGCERFVADAGKDGR